MSSSRQIFIASIWEEVIGRVKSGFLPNTDREVRLLPTASLKVLAFAVRAVEVRRALQIRLRATYPTRNTEK